MNNQVIDRRIDKVVPLVTPALLHHELPLRETQAQAVINSRRTVADVLDGADDRLLVVVGPCSVHDAEAALEYAERLRAIAEKLSDGLHIVMRVYFEKLVRVTTSGFAAAGRSSTVTFDPCQRCRWPLSGHVATVAS